jgi:hypothetical protein
MIMLSRTVKVSGATLTGFQPSKFLPLKRETQLLDEAVVSGGDCDNAGPVNATSIEREASQRRILICLQVGI